MKKMRLQTLLMAFLLNFIFGDVYSQVARETDCLTGNAQRNISQAGKDSLLIRMHEIQTSPKLMRRGSCTYFEGEHLGAIRFPVGGIGTGCIQFDGRAIPRYWQIFNNMTYDFIPNSFLLLRCCEGEKVQIRALQTDSVRSVRGMETLRCRNEFPFLVYEFSDRLPVEVKMSVYNPFIPTDLKNSGIPVVFYRVHLCNTSDRQVEVDLLASQQNAVGFTKVPRITRGKSFAERFARGMERITVRDNVSEFYDKNYNYVSQKRDAEILRMDSKKLPDDEHFGQMALLLLDDGHTSFESSVTASWDNFEELIRRFAKKGDVVEKSKVRPSGRGRTYSGAISTRILLNAQEDKTVNFALVWYFPNGKNGGDSSWDSWGNGSWSGNGNRYACYWPNMDTLIDYIIENHKELYHLSRQFEESFFKTNLPYWAVERLASQLSILKSRTFFHDKTDYVGLWEGCGSGDGAGSGNCNHVWHYAQAHARLFPELARKIRRESYMAMKEDGQFSYRQPAGSSAFDGQCGEILATYREHLLSENAEWLQQQYPYLQKAVDYLIASWDKNADGWLEGHKHTTYDCSLSGNPSFLTSLYLAALKASVKMAAVCHDPEHQNLWNRILEKGMEIQNERLWNGRYYRQESDSSSPASDYGNGCHSDQLLGQWWADQLGLGNLFPSYRMEKAFHSIFKYNFRSVLAAHRQEPREFAKPDEPGLIVCTWPLDKRPQGATAYSDEVWTSLEYNLSASLFKYNDPVDALTLLWAGHLRHDGILKEGYKGEWGNFGFSGNPFGDEECGQFYGRTLSNWSVLLAIQGFEYNAPEGYLAFHPSWQPANHCSFFSTAAGWGNYYQQVTDEVQVNRIDFVYGNLKLQTLTLPNALGSKRVRVVVMLNGSPLSVFSETDEDEIMLSLNALVLKAGDCLLIKVSTM